ncbi:MULTISPECIES: acyltransferase family protein [unclassified Agrococcus]|uniref:acyltransferase family protein n=1 Tax=unclassified Agrococcus TaxID=2615065 RepID=UPI00361CB34E
MTDTKAPRAKRRVPYWDNAKWLAMALVVVGHAIQPIALDSDVALVPYLVIYAFHMPFFGVISGYFTTEKPGAKQYGRVIGDLIVPYVVFETIWSIVEALVSGTWSFNPVTPSWTLWFLLALAGFRVVLPVLARLRWPLVWVTLLAILIGYFDDVDQTFSAMRAIQMLPFFVLGWELRKGDLVRRWLATTRTLWPRVAAVAAFALVGAVVALLPDLWRELSIRHWLFLDRAYAEVPEIGEGGVAWYYGTVRLAIMVVTTMLIAAALVLVPRRATPFTAWGAATMSIYLLHTFVLYWPREFDWLRDVAGEWWATPATIAGGLLLTMALSTTPVRAATRWLVEPNVGWLVRRPRERDDEAARSQTAPASPQPPTTVTDGDAGR